MDLFPHAQTLRLARVSPSSPIPPLTSLGRRDGLAEHNDWHL